MSYMPDNVSLIVYQEGNPLMLPIYYMLRRGCWTINFPTKEGEVSLPLTDGLRSRISSLCIAIEELQRECFSELSKERDLTSLLGSGGFSLTPGRS
jgi:hypothetical protein